MSHENLRVVDELVRLNLIGLDGNSFSLMGAFSKAARRQNTPKEEIDKVVEMCWSATDYNQLLRILMANTEEVDE